MRLRIPFARLWRIGAVELLPLALLAPPAAAGPAAAPEEPPPVVRRTAPAVVKAVVPGDLSEDPSSFTSVIETDRVRGKDKTLADLLSELPGVQVRRFGGPGERAEISIRGSTASQVVILLDGIRLNSARSGAVDLSTIPLSLLERIEVSRGGGSVQQGSDAVGGVVNLITRRVGQRPETRARVSGASFHTARWSLQDARLLGEGEWVAAYDGFHTRGDFRFQRPELRFGGGSITPQPDPLDRVNNRSDRNAGLFKIGRDLGERVHVGLSDLISYTSRGTPGLDAGTDSVGGQRQEAHERLTRNLAVASLDLAGPHWGPDWGLDGKLRVYHRYDRVAFRDPMPRLGTPIDTDVRTAASGARLSLDADGRLAGTDHRASLGLDLRLDALDARADPNRRRRTLGLFLQDDVAFLERRIRLLPALRMDRSEGFGTEWIPRIGLLVAPWGWLRLKANLERSYRVPNFDELFFPDEGFLRGNPGLAPERAVNWDAGLELSLARLGPLRELRLQAAWFHNNVDDSIVFVLVSPFTVAPLNTGPATEQGLELSLQFGLGPWLHLVGSYTRLDAHLDRTGTALPGRADAEAFGRVEIGPPSGALQLFGEVHHTASIPVTFTARTRVSARTVFAAGITLHVARLHRLPLAARDLLLFASADNLTDQSVRDAVFFPQPGRSLHFGAEVVW